MLPISLESIRLFLHITAAAVWVGGQLTLLGLLPVLRGLGPDAPKAAARRFNVIAWSSFAVLFVTGIWSLLAESPGSMGTAWNATLGLKLVMVAATGIAAGIHAGARSKPAIALGGAVSLFAGLAAVLLGVMLTIAPSYRVDRTQVPQGRLMTMATSFTRMDESTQEQWLHIGAQHAVNQGRVADRMLMLLESLAEITDGFNADQLTHCLQTATLAERAGADEEVVFASLMHDVGKAITVANHGAISAEMIKPYVRDDVYQMIRVHQDFQGKHYYHHFGADPDAREKHREDLTPEQFELAALFADEWDQIAFDTEYDTLPLSHFEPLVRKLTGEMSL